MPLPIDYFPQPETFAQANPFLQGLASGQNLLAKALANQVASVQAQYAQPEAQQALLKAQLNNQILQPQAQYAPQMTLAELALKQSMPNYYNAMAGEAGARAGMLGAQTNLLKEQTPYFVDKAQADIFSDPMLSRANQLAMAQKIGQANPYLQSTLGQIGFAQQPNGMAPNQLAQAIGQQKNGVSPNALNAPSMMSGNAIQNYLMFGSPLSPLMQMQLQAYGKGLQTQQTQQAKDYSTQLNEANTSANLGNQIDKFLDQFNEGYKNTNLTGYGLGHLPATTSAAQEADNASQNIAASVAKLIAGGRVTNYEMQYINNLKPNRTMNPEAASIASDFLKQKSLRMQEEQQFLNAAKNSGVDVYTANSLWNQYNNQRPVYDFSNKTPNTQFQNTWKDFLTPQSVMAAQTGQKYVPVPQFANKTEAKNWFKSLNPSDRLAVESQLGGQ